MKPGTFGGWNQLQKAPENLTAADDNTVDSGCTPLRAQGFTIKGKPLTAVALAVVDQGVALPQLLGQELAAAVAAQYQDPASGDVVQRRKIQQSFATGIVWHLRGHSILLPAGCRFR